MVMNELLLRLAVDAGLFVYDDTDRMLINDQAGEDEVSKFASLIIQECINVCYHTPNKCAWKLEQHFEDEDE